MKILLVDHDDLQTETRAILIHEMCHHDVDVVETLEDALAAFEQGKYEVVIIDFALDFGREFLRHIDGADRAQRVIALSATMEYSELKGCDYCIAHHNRRRLMKPVSIQKLILLVEDFDLYPCEYYNTLILPED